MKKILITLAAFLSAALSFAQSTAFQLGKWTEIHNAILKELSSSYVDTLPVDRIEKAGIAAMLESLDPYTVYVAEEEEEDFQLMIDKSYGGIGSTIYKPDTDGNVIITEPYANSPAARSGLVCGDEITAIDGETTHGFTSQECSDRMKGKPGTQVVLTIKKVRGGDTVDVPIVRERIHLPDIEYAGMLDDTTGYILQSGFTDNVSADLKNAILRLKGEGMKKLVYDLRGNGGGILQEAVKIVSLFVPKGSIVVTAKGLADNSFMEYKTIYEPVVDEDMPVVVLVDSGSASASEIVSGALQDYDRATIIGTRTFGKGLVQSIRPLPYNGQLKLTTAKYYTPSGRCVQAIDYSHRNEDGSVGAIPDSLTSEFKTAHGRIVRDGGGITPDVVIESKGYSRLTYSLVVGGIIEQFALEYVRKHESIPAVEDFFLTDGEYQDFVEFAREKEFDYRSSSKTLLDQMKTVLKEEGLAGDVSSELDALESALDMDKVTFLNLKKEEIIPFIEESIAVRYYYQEAGVQVQIRYDEQLKKALQSPLISLSL